MFEFQRLSFLINNLKAHGRLDFSLPPVTPPPAWTDKPLPPGEARLDRFRGALLGVAIGDALGSLREGQIPPKQPPLRSYEPGAAAFHGLFATVSDDTQMSLWLAASLAENHGLDPEDIARRFTSHRLRGIGKATREVMANYKQKKLPWQLAGIASSGNGAAMRATPVGLYYADDHSARRLAGLLQAVVTHDDAMAAASSIVVAEATALLLRLTPQDFEAPGFRRSFCETLAATIKGMEDGRGYASRVGDKASTTLALRLERDVPSLLERDADPAEMDRLFGSGAYVLESVPFAVFCFLRNPGDFDKILLNAANFSKDSDTVAAIACGFAGALLGRRAMATRWLDGLEWRLEIELLADRLQESAWDAAAGLRRERAAGGLLGLAIGDALGVPVEFSSRAALKVKPVTGMRGHGAHDQPAGTWSDDSSLTFCLVESILARGFDLDDLARRFLAWRDSGETSAHGSAFDIGNATRDALDRLASGTSPREAGGRTERDNGNGALMRILPLAVWLADSPPALLSAAVEAAVSLTHRHPRSTLVCLAYCLVAAELARGADADAAVARAAARLGELAAADRLPKGCDAELPLLEPFFAGRIGALTEKDIVSDGYVLNTFTAALWCLLNSSDFRDCVLKAVNLGGDTDTTAAVAGGLAGLRSRLDLPEKWTRILARFPELQTTALRFAALASVSCPFPGSYWVLPGRLLAGSYPGSLDADDCTRKLSGLLCAGVRTAVDLTQEDERQNGASLKPYHGRLRELSVSHGVTVETLRFPITDLSVPAPDQLGRILASIDAGLARGSAVYVHCFGGHGRTGTVLGAWLRRHGLEPALQRKMVADSGIR